MKRITDHIGPGINQCLEIRASREEDDGGAPVEYTIRQCSLTSGSVTQDEPLRIGFQEGSVLELGVNGISHEALLAIVIDRLKSYQRGPYSCRENSLAITNLETALLWLHKRARDRAIHDPATADAVS